MEKKSLRVCSRKNNPTDLLVAFEKSILFVCIFIYPWEKYIGSYFRNENDDGEELGVGKGQIRALH